MSSVKRSFALMKMAAVLLFCFGVGGALVYSGVKDKKGPITFDDVYPGLAAIAAGLILIGLLYWMSRNHGEDESES